MDKPINSYLGKIPTKVDKRSKVIDADQWIKSGKWVLVKSSNVHGISYDQKQKWLSVQFWKKVGTSRVPGKVYIYKQVPRRTAKDFFNASSMGRFHHRRIKTVFPFK